MCIVQPAQVPWRTRPADLPLVQVEVTRFGDGDVTVRLGAAPADLAAALTRLPAHARLTRRAFDDADLTLVFRTPSPGDGDPHPPAASLETRPTPPRQAEAA
jgi:uncharacterized repeat protein (TIGR03917 family)